MNKKILLGIIFFTIMLTTSLSLALYEGANTPKDLMTTNPNAPNEPRSTISIQPIDNSLSKNDKPLTTLSTYGSYIPPGIIKSYSRNPGWADGEYRVRIQISNDNDFSVSEYPAKVHMIFYPAAHKTSIRVIDVETETEIPYQLDSVTTLPDNPDFIRSADIWFYVSLSSNTAHDYYIYWDTEPKPTPSYSTPVTYTVGEGITITTSHYTLKISNGKIEWINYGSYTIQNTGISGLSYAHLGVTFNIPSFTDYGSYGNVGATPTVQTETVSPANDIESPFYGVVFVRYKATLSYSSYSVSYEYLFFTKFVEMRYTISGSFSSTDMLVSAIILDQDGNQYPVIYRSTNPSGDQLLTSDYQPIVYWSWDSWYGVASYSPYSGLSWPAVGLFNKWRSYVPVLTGGAVRLAYDGYDETDDDRNVASVVILPIYTSGDMVDFQVYLQWKVDGADVGGWSDGDSCNWWGGLDSVVDADGGTLMFYNELTSGIRTQLTDLNWEAGNGGGSTSHSSTDIPAGPGLGFLSGGYALEFDYRQTTGDPSDNHIAIINNPSGTHTVVTTAPHGITAQTILQLLDGWASIALDTGSGYTWFTNKKYFYPSERHGYIAISGATSDELDCTWDDEMRDLDFLVYHTTIYIRKTPATYDYDGELSLGDYSLLARRGSGDYYIGLHHIDYTASGVSATVSLYYHNEGDYIGSSGSYPYQDKEDYLLMGYRVLDASGTGSISVKTLFMIDSSKDNIDNYGSSWKNGKVSSSIVGQVEKKNGEGEVLVLYDTYTPTTYSTDYWSDLDLNWYYDSSANQISADTVNGVLKVLDSTDQWFRLWYKQPIYSNYIDIEVKYTISNPNGENAIADGFVIAFYKDKDYSPSSGGSLCFRDPGFGVKVDVYQNSEDPAPAMIAIINGSVDNVLAYRWYNKADLYGTHTVRVLIKDRVIEVFLDGTLILSDLVPEGFSKTYGYVGLTGATGGLYMILEFDYVTIKYADLPGIADANVSVDSQSGTTNSDGAFLLTTLARGDYSVSAYVDSGLYYNDTDQPLHWSETGTLSVSTTDYTLFAGVSEIVIPIKKVRIFVNASDIRRIPLPSTKVYLNPSTLGTGWLYGVTGKEGYFDAVLKSDTYEFAIHFPASDSTYVDPELGLIDFFNATIYDDTYPEGYQFATEVPRASISISSDATLKFIDLNETDPPIYIYPEFASYQLRVYWGDSFTFEFYAYRHDTQEKVAALVQWNVSDVETGNVIFQGSKNTSGGVVSVTLSAGYLVAGKDYMISLRVVELYTDVPNGVVSDSIESRQFTVEARPARIVDAYVAESTIYWGPDEIFTIRARFKDWLTDEYIPNASIWVEIWKGESKLTELNLTMYEDLLGYYYELKIIPYGKINDVEEWAVGTYTLRIVASKGNYTSDSYTIGIYISPRPTIFKDVQSFISITWTESYNISVKYWDVRANTIVPNGKVTYRILRYISQTEYEVVIDTTNANYDPISKTYILVIRIAEDLGETGTYLIQVNATKANYEAQFQTITMYIKEIYMEISAVTSNYELTWGDNITYDFRLKATGDNGTWGVDIPIPTTTPTESATVYFKFTNGTPSRIYGKLVENVGNGEYRINLQSGFYVPGVYSLTVVFSKKYYTSVQKEFIVTIKKVQGYIELRVEGQVGGTVTITKNPITGSASAKVEVFIREQTGVPISGAVVEMRIWRGLTSVENLTLTEDPYIPGVYKTTYDFTAYEPGTYHVEIVVLSFTRNGYTAPHPGHNVSEYLTLSGYSEVTVNIEYLGGGLKVAGQTVPVLLVVPVATILLVAMSVLTYKWANWMRLPPEIRELIKLIRDIENDRYEYSAPEREDFMREIVMFELGL